MIKIERYVTDTYPERVQLTLGGDPIDLSTLREVVLSFKRYDETRDILCQKDTNGYVFVPFYDAGDADTIGCFPFDIKSEDVNFNKITFIEGIVEFKKGYGVH